MAEWYEKYAASKILDFHDGQKLYLGNINNTRALHHGNPLGIQAVLDVSEDDDYNRHPEIVYLRVPFPDGHEIPADAFAKCMEFLSVCWDNKLTIQVNCAAGISRSTSIVCSFIYLKKIGYRFSPALDTIDRILEYVSKCRTIVHPNPSVFSSCKKHLKIFPYDGSLGEAEPIVRLDKLSFAKLMKIHKNRECPVRLSILNNDNTERHLLHCTCGLEL
jgi:predicted protein tyrosine phosphatase